MLTATPAFADGGSGGGATGGTGGTDNLTGGTGGAGAAGTGSGGGGGGGSGGKVSPVANGGGSGGNGSGGALGGTGSTSVSTAGGTGAAGAAAGDGGGGGGGGFNLTLVNINNSTSAGNFTASAGGNGGAGNGNGSGGGGGSGGNQIVFTVNATDNNSAPNLHLTGGKGGDGGASATGFGGAGGAGGAGAVFLAGGTETIGSGTVLSGGAGGVGGVGGAGNGANGAGGVGISGGNLTINNSGTISGGLSGDGVTRANSIVFTGGNNFITFNNGTSGLVGNVSLAGTLTFNQPTNTTVGQVISGTGSVIKTGAGTLVLSVANGYSGGTTITAGTLQAANAASLGTNTVTLNGGNLQAGAPVSLTNAIAINTAGGAIDSNGVNFQLSGAVADGNGAGVLTKTGAGTLILAGANTYTGLTNINAGTLSLSGGLVTIASSAGVSLNAAGTTFSISDTVGNVTIKSLVGVTGSTMNLGANRLLLSNASGTFAGVLQGTNGLTLTSGTETLSGTSTYTGTTVVDGGKLVVNGDIHTSTLTTVNAGGTIGGSGTVGNLTVNGGTLSPGNSPGTLTVSGNLVLTAAATYFLEVTPIVADRVNVTGTATLNGAAVTASFAAGTYVTKQYTIVNATGGVIGTFGSLVNSNLPTNFHTSLSYGGNNAYLNLALNFVPPPGTGLNINQQNVANAITNFFNTTGGIPLVFGSLTPTGLTQLSGESATGSQQTTFDAVSQFMGLLTDPFIGGRGDTGRAGGAPNAYSGDSLGYAAHGQARSTSERDAYAAMYTKAPIAPTFQQRWSVWTAGYGGTQNTNGDMRVLGSNDTRSSVYGTVVGADYRFSPNTIAGFALAGGGTSFNVNGLGYGRSDLFQVGAFVRHAVGPAYITGALAYGWQDVTTDRTLMIAGVDQLRAEFKANAWSGRVEGGYRFVAPVFGDVGVTPYAAGQFVTFSLPSYMEQAIVGSNQFALTYNSKSVTDPRSELGFRTDKSYAAESGIFTLRSRYAWAHDYNPDRSIGATFQTLPGASFIVNGARQAADSVITSASAEWKWLNGWSAGATLEGEFSNVTSSYAGKGIVRYTW